MNPEIHSYGQKVRYDQNQLLQFPNFSVEYVGTKDIPGPNGAQWSITMYVFKISDTSTSIEIAWSAGTGMIAPRVFEFGGNQYILEKMNSERIGSLEDNEFVISTSLK